MDSLLDVLGLLGGAAGGGLFGLVGAIASSYLKNKERALELAHEIELAKVNAEEMRLESELRLQELDKRRELIEAESAGRLAETQEATAGRMLEASIKADKATYSKGLMDRMSGMTASIVGLMLGFVDVFRGLIRPGATAALVVMVWILYRDINQIVGGLSALPMTEVVVLWFEVTRSIIALAFMALGWWFGARYMKKEARP